MSPSRTTTPTGAEKGDVNKMQDGIGTMGVHTFEYVGTQELEDTLNAIEQAGTQVISVYMTWGQHGSMVWVIYRDMDQSGLGLIERLAAR